MPETIEEIIRGFVRAISNFHMKEDLGPCGNAKQQQEEKAEIQQQKQLMERSLVHLATIIASARAFKEEGTTARSIIEIFRQMPGYMPAAVVATCVQWLGYGDDQESGINTILLILNHRAAEKWERLKIPNSVFPALTVTTTTYPRNVELAQVVPIPYGFPCSDNDWDID